MRTVVSVGGRDIPFDVPSNDNVGNQIDAGTFEKELTEKLCAGLLNSDVFLDIGANVGYFSVVASVFCDIVIAIEPDPVNWPFLRKNTPFSNVGKMNLAAVTDGEGPVVEMYAGRGNCGATSICKENVNDFIGSFFAPTVGVYDLVKCVRPTVVKSDVQGFDFSLLREGIQSFTGRLWIMEWWPEGMANFGVTPEEARDWLDRQDRISHYSVVRDNMYIYFGV